METSSQYVWLAKLNSLFLILTIAERYSKKCMDGYSVAYLRMASHTVWLAKLNCLFLILTNADADSLVRNAWTAIVWHICEWLAMQCGSTCSLHYDFDVLT